MRCSGVCVAILAVAPAINAQRTAPNVLSIERIKAHMREELSRMPNYTCLETTDRFYPSQKNLLQPDTLRLEIVYIPEGANGMRPRGTAANTQRA
ncbi:MAG: hypothetical protein JO062_01995 [Bryobacterales bacterium]|nr:hypothetical protein [Bryobacterales bacterium]